MEEALSFYKNLNIDKSIIEKILNFNYYQLDSISDLDLSKYCIILSQYLVYFKWQINKTKAEHLRVKNKLDSAIFSLMTAETIKKYKTKADAKSYLIESTPELSIINEQVSELEYEIVLSDGLDKPVQEMINVLKREQSRRENEQATARFERR